MSGSTYAGGPLASSPIPALDAAISQPQALTANAHGNVYFTSLSSVFKLESSGILTRVAGNTRWGYSGDGGPAISAELGLISGLAVDDAGNIFLADQSYGGIRRLRLTS